MDWKKESIVLLVGGICIFSTGLLWKVIEIKAEKNFWLGESYLLLVLGALWIIFSFLIMERIK